MRESSRLLVVEVGAVRCLAERVGSLNRNGRPRASLRRHLL